MKAVLCAAGLYVVDAFMLNQGFISILVIVLALLYFVPRALWVLRKDRGLASQHLAKVGILLLSGLAVFGTNYWQNCMADHKAIEVGDACIAYRAKYNRYPERLADLVPEFMPSVPPAKYTLGGNDRFMYFRPLLGAEPMLFYEAVPPFGRRFYHMERHTWGFLD
jgi:hypothetical protein